MKIESKRRRGIKVLCFIFTIVWFVELHLCFGDAALDNFIACSEYYNCGDLVDIYYPFWGNNRPESCGRRHFKLNCKNNKTTTILINSIVFNVLNISQANNRMTIARSDLFDDYCPSNQIDAATMDNSPFRYSSKDLNLSLWYNCSSLGEIQLNYTFECGSDEERSGRANYAFLQEAWSSYLNIRDCEVRITVTITIDVLKVGEKSRTMMVERGLKEGFEVEYGDFYTIACEGCKEYGGACGGNATQEFYCVCGSGDINPYVCKSPPWPRKSAKWKKTVIGASAAGASIILIISVIIITIKCISHNDRIEETITSYSTQTPKRYSYSKLKKITNSFNNNLGQGGFSTVYKGKLPDGRDVAVKLLNDSSRNAQDFVNEVVSSTTTSHVNVASLLGFCYQRKKRALIYEYMPRGSLEKYISHKGPQENNFELDWNTLYRILIGVARGLEYLHRGCNTRILHFDIKPHNILLDSDFCPKISDFGLAKQYKAKETHVTMTGMKGTPGFIAPEVVFRNLGKVSHKSDVYSYGMLILQMVGARKKPRARKEQRSEEEYFPDWIYNDLTQSELDGSRWWGNTEEEEEIARKMIIVGLHCIQTSPDDRPSMTAVVTMLEGSVNGLEIPPKPNLFESPRFEQPTQFSYSSSNWDSV